MAKVLSFSLVCLAVFSLSACGPMEQQGGDKGGVMTAKPTVVEPKASEGETMGDQEAFETEGPAAETE